MNDTQIIWAVIALAAVVGLVVLSFALVRRGRQRTAMLRQRFGGEYGRAKERYGSRAERELAERLHHVEQLRIRELSDAERERFTSAWAAIQAQFIDDPQAAAGRANDLIKEVMRARGYSADDAFERRAADLSVDHPDVVEHYRAAHALARSEEPINTEDLRQAVVHYRVIFEDLLARAAQPATPVVLRPAQSPV
ncbi:MAG TPA: hypothetical protein VLM85_14450 [Polyangiaceae bacterium]|nr:hypothetical protein [Polyangiaceae bacterium]